MIDGITVCCRTRLYNFGIANLEIVRSAPNQCWRSGQSENAGVKKFGIGLEDLAGIALRVDRNENGLDVFGVLAQLLQNFRHLDQSGWTDVWAVGVAESDQLIAPTKIIAGVGTLVRVLQQIAWVDADRIGFSQ